MLGVSCLQAVVWCVLCAVAVCCVLVARRCVLFVVCYVLCVGVVLCWRVVVMFDG